MRKKKRIKKKRSFSEFARSEIDEVKYAGGFFLFLALFLNFEPRLTGGWDYHWKSFLIALGFIIFFGILIIFDQFQGWIKYLKEK